MATMAVLHMRIDPTLKATLARMARVENRSLANLVETVLKRHVEGQQTPGRTVRARRSSPA